MNLRKEFVPETEYTSRPLRNIKLFCGLISNEGIEQIHSKDDNFNPIILNLRARFNTGRNMRQFVCCIKEKYIPKDFNKFNGIELYKILKHISINFVEF